VYIYNFVLGMIDTMTSQNIDLSSWDTLSYGYTSSHLLTSQSDKRENQLLWDRPNRRGKPQNLLPWNE
jgi:hypothetical protein